MYIPVTELEKNVRKKTSGVTMFIGQKRPSTLFQDLRTMEYRIFSIKRRTTIKRRPRKKRRGQNCRFLIKRRVR